jgi:hypothetical protein
MRLPRHPLLPVAVALSTWTACHQPQSVLLVEVSGDLALAPVSLSVTVTAGLDAQRTYFIAPASGVVSLPASFTIELPGSVTGPVTVAIAALDTVGGIVADGQATRRNLNVGGQTILVVTLADAGTINVTTPDAGGVDAQPPSADAHPIADAQADAPPAHDAGGDSRPSTDAGGGQ